MLIYGRPYDNEEDFNDTRDNFLLILSYYALFLNTILTPFRGIEGRHSASSVVAADAAPFG